MSSEKIFQTSHLERNLKKSAVRGGSLTVVSQGIRLGLRLISTAILARLLSPEDYGLIGMTLVVSGFVGIIRDGGLIYATVQKESISHKEVSALFWINVALGIFIAITLVCLSPLVSLVFSEPRLTPLLCVLAIPFLFGGCTVQHKALMRRNFQFGKIAVLEIGSLVCGITVGIIMAYLGYGFWSLAFMEVAISVSAMLLAWWLLPWIPSRPNRVDGLLTTLKFGGNVVAFNVVNFFARNADKALIGWFWGAASLGLYSRAYSLLMMPIERINAPFSNVAVAILSRAANDPKKLRRYFCEAVSMVSAIVIPIVVYTAVFAEDLVRIWLGEQWMETAKLFQLLAMPALLIGASVPVTWIYIVLDRTNLLRNVGLVMAPVNVVAFCIGLPFGPEGVALGYTISSCLLFLPILRYALNGTGISMMDVFRTWRHPLISAAAGAGAGLIVKAFVPFQQSQFATAFVSVGVFGLVYGLVMCIGFGWHKRVLAWYARKSSDRGIIPPVGEPAN
ncbi:lipopolysaccharide biosynthesis protein [Pelagicoccus mobilis]|uniref:Lipopolysaccharide biosynthesis protein n=1 Tax=Pelagicoccus mobilis TaxID=415221 RepID=A0A934RYQ4_9BACT|nr:lipopolysaccharide biosynthesis protein [Pelagicoccus mobilis]MBK1877950.1 lipopolysaccharide biosynthesis protein [Pelagicoccus mobilis]